MYQIGENVTISDFARTHGVDPQAVRRYLIRHPEIKKYTKRAGKEIHILPDGEAMLEKIYPLPKPIEVVEDRESREKLIRAQEMIIKLQQRQTELVAQIADQAAQLAQLEAAKLLLEDREQRIREKDEALRAAEERVVEAEAEVARLKGRGLWERIINA